MIESRSALLSFFRVKISMTFSDKSDVNCDIVLLRFLFSLSKLLKRSSIFEEFLHGKLLFCIRNLEIQLIIDKCISHEKHFLN